MSLNIHFSATREILVFKSGGLQTQTTIYDGTWQTPTTVSKSIISSEHPIQAYKDWVKSIGSDEVVPVYQESDFFNEGEPVGFEVINSAEEHIKEFEEWLEEMNKGCWEVKVEMW